MGALKVQAWGAWSRKAAVVAALGCLGAAPWQSQASGVSKVRFGGDQFSTRVVLELDRSIHGKLIYGGKGGRLVLALPGLQAGADVSGEGQGLVRSWSIDHVAGATTLELKLTRPVQIARRFLLAPSEGAPEYRYVVDLTAAGPASAAPEALMRINHVAPSQRIHLKKVVVIDAGHGGKDPGALGQGVEEKDVTLAAARTLKRRLERDGRYQVVLTRSSDVFVPLQSRVKIARRAEADLFISLHADAGSDPELRGATVYTLSDKGSDRAAEKLLNGDDWFIRASMPSRDRSVNQILLDLTQRATKNQSSAFAETLVSWVGSETPLLQRSHRDAGYVVLLAPDVPAVLLEMGFITNGEDETALRDPRRRARLMDAVGDAIDGYFSGQRRYAAR